MPGWWDYKRSALLTFLALPFGLRAEQRYRRMPVLPAGSVAAARSSLGALPSLTIVIPARNEADNLPVLLASLAKLRYPGERQVLVVDDHSQDRTAEIAREYGVGVLQLTQGLPPGWMGKPHALHQGALASQTEWLLFTDADTIHTPDGAARSVECAVQSGLDGLSLFLRQVPQDWSDRLALSAAYAGLFAGENPANALLNGQFILLKRSVYLESGGFSTVCREPLEDVALGNHLARLGYRVPVMLGEDAAAVRMYRGPRQMFNGLSRLAFGSLEWQSGWAAVTALFITALMSPLIVLVGVLSGQLRMRWLPITWATSVVSLLPWARRFDLGGLAVLAPVGALIVQAAGIAGFAMRLLGRGISWKGRRV